MAAAARSLLLGCRLRLVDDRLRRAALAPLAKEPGSPVCIFPARAATPKMRFWPRQHLAAAVVLAVLPVLPLLPLSLLLTIALRHATAVMRREELSSVCDADNCACVAATPALATVSGAFARMVVRRNDVAASNQSR